VSVQGLVVLVTDTAHEIGTLIAREFASRGALVSALASQQAVAEVRHHLQDAGAVEVLAGDVTNVADVEQLVDGAIARHGRVDVLIATHHTEGSHPVSDSHEVDLADWDEIFNVNVRAGFVACQRVLPHMVAQRSGVILQIASTTGLQAAAFMNANNAASAATIQLCRGLAVEYRRHNIRVNAVVVAGTFHSSSERIRDGYAVRHQGETLTRGDEPALVAPPRDLSKIARCFVALADPDAADITGGTIPVDGGLAAGLATSALLENASIGRWAWPV
jgi:NAD(P)-dependent dehydrogenase (short-subunit alcohol dehydrogenase family)